MKRYRTSLFWIVDNDDTRWITDYGPISITASLVAYMYGVSEEKVRVDLLQLMKNESHDEE